MDPVLIDLINHAKYFRISPVMSGRVLREITHYEKHVLIYIASVSKCKTDLMSIIPRSELKSEYGEKSAARKFVDLIQKEEKVTKAAIAKATGYTWKRTKQIVDGLIKIGVLDGIHYRVRDDVFTTGN